MIICQPCVYSLFLLFQSGQKKSVIAGLKRGYELEFELSAASVVLTTYSSSSGGFGADMSSIEVVMESVTLDPVVLVLLF